MKDFIRVDILRNIRGKSAYQNVIDKEFRELIPEVSSEQITVLSPEEFITLFNDFIYTLPIEGNNSVTYIYQRAADILNVNIDNGLNLQELLDEITRLKEENFNLLQQVITLSNPE